MISNSNQRTNTQSKGAGKGASRQSIYLVTIITKPAIGLISLS